MTPDTFLALTARNDQPAFLLTHDGQVLAANPPGSDLLGHGTYPATGVKLGGYVDSSAGPFESLMAAWTAAGVPLTRPLPIRRPDGRKVQCRAEGLGLTDPGDGSHSMVLLHVVPLDPVPPLPLAPVAPPAAKALPGRPAKPEPRETPTERSVGKMEAMSNLAGGIAHDFNNLLTVMKVEVELVLEDEDAPPRIIDSLLACHTAILDAEALVRGLLAFSRHQLISTTHMDLSAVLDHAIPALRPFLGDTRLKVERATEALPLRVDGKQVELVLQALVRNAVEASSPGNPVVVRTRRERVDPGFVRENEGAREGDYAVIEVEDRGSGITPEVAARMFEPFYTTKGRGRGRGLGLAQAFGIVKMLGGYIKVDTEPDEGSKFAVYLPLERGPA